jgi:hypothetical protein
MWMHAWRPRGCNWPAGRGSLTTRPTDYLGRATAIVDDTGYERRRAELVQLRAEPRLSPAPPKTRRAFPGRRKQTPANTLPGQGGTA